MIFLFVYFRSSRASRTSTMSLKTKPTVNASKKRPSAAAIIAKRKTRIATLTASASTRNSRMLARLTPRGTASDVFVKKAKKMHLDGKSLRGRDISVSSEEEEVAEKQNKKPTAQQQPNTNRKSAQQQQQQKPPELPNTSRKMVCRKTARYGFK